MHNLPPCNYLCNFLHLCNLHRSFTSFICSRSSLMRLLSITWLVSISISSFWLVDATLVDAKVLLNWKGRWCAVWSQMNSLTSSNDSQFFSNSCVHIAMHISMFRRTMDGQTVIFGGNSQAALTLSVPNFSCQYVFHSESTLSTTACCSCCCRFCNVIHLAICKNWRKQH